MAFTVRLLTPVFAVERDFGLVLNPLPRSYVYEIKYDNGYPDTLITIIGDFPKFNKYSLNRVELGEHSLGTAMASNTISSTQITALIPKIEAGWYTLKAYSALS